MHLAVEVVGNLLKAFGHQIERLSQLTHFVVGGNLDAITEISLSHPAGSLVQFADRFKQVPPAEPHESQQQHDHHAAGNP